MNRPTLQALNRINRAFYSSAAAEFSASRRRAWPGFARTLGHIRESLPPSGVPRVLDVGCGNGRFADALLEGLEGPFRYLGVDASKALLAEARARHGQRGDFHFVAHDFVLDDLAPVLGGERFQVVLLLGVLHHVPGAATRTRLLAECARRLAPGGLLVLTLWRFETLERLRRRIAPWEGLPDRREALLDAIDLQELEPGDHLLRFGPGEGRLRYCHAFGADEIRELLLIAPFEPAGDWLADGETGELNRWLVLRKR